MGWGWLCYAKTGRLVATFSTVSRFLLPFRAESGTAAKLSFCNGPFFVISIDNDLITEKQLVSREGVTEQLKAQDQMLWVQRMNNNRIRAMEVVNNDLIYA